MELKVEDTGPAINAAQMRRYGAALLLAIVAIVARVLLDSVLEERLQLATLYAAVAVSALYLGRGPAIATLITGLAGLVFVIIQPRYSFGIDHPADILTVVFYAGVSAAIIALTDQLRAAVQSVDVGASRIRQSEADLSDLFDNATIGLHWVGPDGVILRANRAELDMLGYAHDEYVGHPIAQFHVDQDAIGDMLARLLRGERLHEQPARMRCKDGTIKDVLIDSSGMFREGRFVHTRCFTRDITERKRSEIAKRESDARFRQLADAMPQIVWTAGADGQIDYLNSRWHEYTGLPVTIGNTGWTQVMHNDDLPLARERWAKSLQDGGSFELEVRLLDHRTQSYRWHLMRTVAISGAEETVLRWFGTATDMHEQKCAEQAAHFLAEASALLAGVEDCESTLKKVASLAVPYFADWSAVDMTNADGTLRRLAVAHRDAAKIALVHRLEEEYPADPDADTGAYAVLRSGKSQIVSSISDDMLVQAAKDERHLEMVRSLGLQSYICVPLVVSGRPVGVFHFATAESGRGYGRADLVIAENLANRAAVAIENANLYEALRESDRRKDEFLATLAHELRNPLAPLANALQVLKWPDVDRKVVAQSRDMMERQVQQLVRLVDDLLDVSRVSAGKIELRMDRSPMAAIIDLAIETVRPLLDAREQKLVLTMPDDRLIVDADAARLSQVVGNILQNAAKYSPPGSSILLSAVRENDEAVLRIRDHGIGIDASMLDRIFQLFVQADQSTTKAHGGLGVGLTLAKDLVKLHGGRITAHSEGLGKGSEFVVRLPLAPADGDGDPVVPDLAGHDMSTSQQQDARCDGERALRVLIVDDNVDAATSLAMLLTLDGHEARVEHSGQAALALAENFTPDVVFLDIGMPGMDGFEVARQLRRRAAFERVLFAALTGWGHPEDRRRTEAAGFSHHLVKPPEPGDIEAVLASARQGTGGLKPL